MKIEARGKYAGVKVHLDGEEAQMFLDFVQEQGKDGKPHVIKFASKLGSKIAKLIEEVPNLLEDRTDEQIEKALKGDAEKIEKQLKALGKGGDGWKHV